jgi:glycosyltransferase involved in cell wall biosynthesis
MLGEHPGIDLTIAHFAKQKFSFSNSFDEELLICKKFGPFFFIEGDLVGFCNNFNVVIAMGDIHFISLMALGRNHRRTFKLVYWGIGLSASYKNKLDGNKKWDFLRFYFMKGADAQLFYSSYPIERYLNKGFRRECLFVADNTVEVKRNIYSNNPRKSLLFIGTLYKEKGIYELLEAYKEAYKLNSELAILNVIGSGNEYNNIAEWIKTNSLDKNIFLHGVIYEDDRLEGFFSDAIASISPNQAGLSVLKSMGYGVPFITRSDSITGGERFNIVNNETGIIYYTKDDLVQILCNIEKDKESYRLMGEKSSEFYQNFRLPKHMVQGFLDVIEYVYTKKD